MRKNFEDTTLLFNKRLAQEGKNTQLPYCGSHTHTHLYQGFGRSTEEEVARSPFIYR